jgi:hypothetical protein
MHLHWLLAHFIGDFLLQNDWMAREKKKNDLACSAHVVAYMVPFFFCGFVWWQLLLIAAQHYAIDRSNFVYWFMGVTGRKQFREAPFAPWSLVITDNLLHIIWIVLLVWLPEVVGR